MNTLERTGSHRSSRISGFNPGRNGKPGNTGRSFTACVVPHVAALVAMGAVFGAASRAPFTFIIFAFEITRDYNSVLPPMLVSVIADGIAMLLMPKSSIMTEKLARPGGYPFISIAKPTFSPRRESPKPWTRNSRPLRSARRWEGLRSARHDPAVARH